MGAAVLRSPLLVVLIGSTLAGGALSAEPAAAPAAAPAPVRDEEPTLLEWTRQRILAEKTDFVDDPGISDEVLAAEVNRDRGLGFLGIASGLGYFRAPDQHIATNEVRLEGELGLVVDSYPRQPGLVGKTSRLGLRVSFGGGSDSAHSEISGALGTGGLITLDRAGSGLFARILGSGATVLEPGRNAFLGNVGIPIGYLFDRDDWRLEAALWPSLGWTAIVVDDINRGTGPLFFGGMTRLHLAAGYLDAEFARAMTGGEAQSLRVSSCTFLLRDITVCADGWLLELHDIGSDEPVDYGRVGVRVGIGAVRKSEGESLPQLIRTH